MMKLHEAIAHVLNEHGSGLTAHDITDTINSRKLYQRGDKRPLPTSQIHARVNEYPLLFKKVDGMIYLVNQQG